MILAEQIEQVLDLAEKLCPNLCIYTEYMKRRRGIILAAKEFAADHRKPDDYHPRCVVCGASILSRCQKCRAIELEAKAARRAEREAKST